MNGSLDLSYPTFLFLEMSYFSTNVTEYWKMNNAFSTKEKALFLRKINKIVDIFNQRSHDHINCSEYSNKTNFKCHLNFYMTKAIGPRG